MDSGWLQKQGNSIRKGWRPRWFWVDHEQHCLKYAEKQGEKPLGSIPFATVQARVNNSSSKPFAIDFVTPNRTYYVAAKSQEEQLAWIDLFRRATKAAIDGVPLNAAQSSAPASPAVPRSSEPSSSPSSTLSRTSVDQSSPRGTPTRLSSSSGEKPPSGRTTATEVLDSQTPHRPVLDRVMSAWNVVKSNVERGVLFIQDPITMQYSRKVAEVRGENLFLYSSEAKATQRRNSSTAIVLTMCQVRPGRLPEADDASAPGAADDAIFRVFSLVTPLSTFYFLAQTVPEASRWIRVFQHIQKIVVSSPNTQTDTPPTTLSPSQNAQTWNSSEPSSSRQPSTTSEPDTPTPTQQPEKYSPRTTQDAFIQARPSQSLSPQQRVQQLSPRVNLPLQSSQPNRGSPPTTDSDILTREIPTIGVEMMDAQTRRILEVAGNPDNRRCADCRDENPEWASINLGIFICLECSGIHRSLGTHISKVRSVDLDRWDDAMIAGMVAVGNVKSNAIYEAELKETMVPTPHSSRGEKDRFIKAKYVQRMFCAGGCASQPTTGSPGFGNRASTTLASLVYQEGHLNKSSESEKGWRNRWVVLKENKLLFYKARADPDPRSTISLSHAHVKSTTLDRINTFELVVPGDVHYLQAENSSDFFLWMDLIKTSQKLFKSSQMSGSSTSPQNGQSDASNSGGGDSTSNASPGAPEEVYRTGWLYKRGEKVKNWKKRWFVLKDNKLTYYASKSDKQPKGSIALSLAVPKEGVHEAGTSIKGLSDSSYTFTFEIVVTGRVYYIAATSQLETREWINTIRASKKAHESRVALSMAAAMNKDLAMTSPEQALEAMGLDPSTSHS